MKHSLRTSCMLFAAAVTLTACAASSRKPDASPAPAPPALDGSYDWHVLMAAPFGTLLKDIPLTLHEVLLFRDDGPRAATEDPECYAPDNAAPQFVARTPD